MSPVIARPLQEPQADGIEDHRQQRPVAMGDFRQLRHVFQAAEEIGMLQEDAGRAVVHRRFQGRRRDAAVRRGDADQFHVQVGQVGRQDLAVLGMDALGRHHAGRARWRAWP